MGVGDNRAVARIRLDGEGIKTPEDCYEQFFRGTEGLVPDLGGRVNWNLDGLNDDLHHLTEPLTVLIDNSEAASRELGEWFWRFVGVLSERGDRAEPIEVVLTSTADLSEKRICLRCGFPVVKSADDYETFERMHWICFHYEFEHGHDRDPDVPCTDPGCPSQPR